MIEALFSLAEIHRRRGDADAAALYLEKIKEIKPDTEKAYIYLGHLYYAKRHARNRAYILALAIKNLKQAEDLNPDNYETLYLLSDIYRHMGDDVRADEYRARAMDLEKRSGEPEFKRGN
jgi:Flp pilus assembly protein TadD